MKIRLKIKSVSLFFFFLLILGNLPQSEAASEGFKQRFFCTDGDNGYRMLLFENDKLEAYNEENTIKEIGHYEVTDKKITLKVPNLGFEEQSLQEEWGKGILLTFRTKSLFCHSTAHNIGPSVLAEAVCPTIRVIPGLSYEDNQFTFYPNHMVKWRQWKELVKVSDTLYSEHFGIYLIEGKTFTLFFGDKKEERILSGDILNGEQQILIHQLEPERGPCQIN